MPKTGVGAVRDPADYRDRNIDWLEYFNRHRREEIARIVREHPEIIAEHALNPFGYRNHPSPYLQRIHNYFRMQPTLGKYYIYTVEPWRDYRIAVVGEFGTRPVILDEPHFDTEEAALHGVFLQRINDVLNGEA
ncbi:hypothetical protein [Mycobacterium sp. 141]|uniref:hypothetical protein n=1 Tax=Mycobacterium sp. 141 TaxID=1120797 RepID=UPI0003824F10|nr:hypothetical protein [Mycobacterium sp. 141]